MTTNLYTIKNNEGMFVGSMNVPSGTNNHSAGVNWFDAMLYGVPVPVLNGRKVISQKSFEKMIDRNPGEALVFENIIFENVVFPLGMLHLFKDNTYIDCYLGTKENAIFSDALMAMPVCCETLVMA